MNWAGAARHRSGRRAADRCDHATTVRRCQCQDFLNPVGHLEERRNGGPGGNGDGHIRTGAAHVGQRRQRHHRVAKPVGRKDDESSGARRGQGILMLALMLRHVESSEVPFIALAAGPLRLRSLDQPSYGATAPKPRRRRARRRTACHRRCRRELTLTPSLGSPWPAAPKRQRREGGSSLRCGRRRCRRGSTAEPEHAQNPGTVSEFAFWLFRLAVSWHPVRAAEWAVRSPHSLEHRTSANQSDGRRLRRKRAAHCRRRARGGRPRRRSRHHP